LDHFFKGPRIVLCLAQYRRTQRIPNGLPTKRHGCHSALGSHPDEAAACTGFSRSRIYEALASGALTARKNGKATVIELVELQRWLSTLPTRGRRPTMVEAGASAA
jgi:hypothetical protein